MNLRETFKLKQGVTLVVGPSTILMGYAQTRALAALGEPVVAAKESRVRIFNGAAFRFNDKLGRADNLGDGMHWTDIEKVYEHLRTEPLNGVPWLISTMHPTVMDFLPLASAEDARERLIFADKEGMPMQFDENEADSFFAYYEAGLQHVSEILRTHGWW